MNQGTVRVLSGDIQYYSIKMNESLEISFWQKFR